MTSFVSGQDEPNPTLWLATRADKIERYCLLRIAHFVPGIKFHRSPSRCTKVFFPKYILQDRKKIFCDFSAGIELENEPESESVNENKNKDSKNVDECQKYILQQKLANTKVKTQSDKTVIHYLWYDVQLDAYKDKISWSMIGTANKC